MYFSEKLNGVALNYPTYDKELYALDVSFLDSITISEGHTTLSPEIRTSLKEDLCWHLLLDHGHTQISGLFAQKGNPSTWEDKFHTRKELILTATHKNLVPPECQIQLLQLQSTSTRLANSVYCTRTQTRSTQSPIALLGGQSPNSLKGLIQGFIKQEGNKLAFWAQFRGSYHPLIREQKGVLLKEKLMKDQALRNGWH
ncbi:uncharacterized protein LOC127149446 [Cucumis melo]|uniref:Uncharacterized protein LOC127149446 n=1 Tax=Cucumis melo TaxID=3656 RepID=A0ABM3KT04_CUCME|nr:uncharacterized protein LOC127149446 [Cucumis melo]